MISITAPAAKLEFLIDRLSVDEQAKLFTAITAFGLECFCEGYADHHSPMPDAAVVRAGLMRAIETLAARE